MAAPTGRKPGRPLAIERLVRLAARDATPAALATLVRNAGLGDTLAAVEVLRLALYSDRGPKPPHGE